MKTLSRISFFSLIWLLVPMVGAQTATPSTTICAAATATATSVCLASTTGVVNQTGLYVDQEYMLVQLSSSQTLAATNAYVPVSRNNRNAGSGPTAHANASIVWVALTPSSSVVPGNNGFSLGTNMTNIGTCTRTAQTYLPHIFVNRGIKRDCSNGSWVDFAPGSGLDFPSPSPQTAIAATGALEVASGNYIITKSSAAAVLTLTAPTAGVQDGMTIILISQTAQAHTLTATTLLENGASGSPYTTATFGAYIGASITLRAKNGVWMVIASSNVTLS